MNLKGRSFLKLLDFTPAEITYLLGLAAELKAKKKAGIPHRIHEGKNIALLFEKDSTRTRCAFEVAGHDLGMGVTYLGPTGSQMGKKESIADTARVLGRMYDGIEYRGYAQTIIEQLAKFSGVPVWNGLTNEFHPTQILADFLTIQEHFGGLQGKKLVYMGDARYNMGDSLMVGCAKMGMHFVACAPEKYFPDPALIEQCQAVAAETGGAGIYQRSRQSRPRCGRDLHRRVGLHGRAGQRLAGADRRPDSLSGDKGIDEKGRKPVPVPPLSPRLPRPEHHRWPSDLRQVRHRLHGGDRRGLRGASVHRLRRSGKPDAHHQGRHGGDAIMILPAAFIAAGSFRH